MKLPLHAHYPQLNFLNQFFFSKKKGYDAKYFVVDSKTGIVTTAVSLPVRNYLLEAIAQIPSGDKDHARVRTVYNYT